MATRPPFTWSLFRMFRISTGFAVFCWMYRHLDQVPHPFFPADVPALLLSVLVVVFAVRGNELLATTFLICAVLKSAIEFLHFPFVAASCESRPSFTAIAREFAVSSAALPTFAISVLLGFGQFPPRTMFHRNLRWIWVAFGIATINVAVMTTLLWQFFAYYSWW